jgi:DNA-binding NarL/FixJ family response regulator
MNRPHLCLSDSSVQLLRWQEAFPKGRIVSNEAQLTKWMVEDAMVWLNIDRLTHENLSRICSQLLSAHPNSKLIAITCAPEPGSALNYLKIGMVGYCHAMAAPACFHQIDQVVNNGGYWLGEELVKHLVGTLEKHPPPVKSSDKTKPLSTLSPRERQVALLVSKGAANKEIARNLSISERTVKAHLGSIFQKLGVRDRLQLALLLR